MKSIYIHFPFCKTRCGYCDFNTYEGVEYFIPNYIDALCKEIQWIGKSTDEVIQIHSIYFGGGTPSLIRCNELEKLLFAIRNTFRMSKDCEITLELNPGGIDRSYVKSIRSAGINRLSIGVQSFSYSDLSTLERNHNPLDVFRVVESARTAGFSNISMDLIFGIPGQTLMTWQETMKTAVGLCPEHLSLYSLILETNTRLYQQILRGLIGQINDDLAADMYDLACDYLNTKKFKQYEISNWGLIDGYGNFAYCRHNMQYWKNLEYLGFGAGAHGYIEKYRTVNCLTPWRYIKLSKMPYQNIFPKTFATIELQKVEKTEEMKDFMFLGLRLVDKGVSINEFCKRFNNSPLDLYAPQINELIDKGLLEFTSDDSDIIRLTKRGKLLANQVFREFV
jgi:oxygen-independent coproporphyrinogen-3 oxidase